MNSCENKIQFFEDFIGIIECTVRKDIHFRSFQKVAIDIRVAWFTRTF